MAAKADVGIEIHEESVPIATATASAGSVLGIEPMNVANEGIVVFGADPEDAEAILDAIQDHPLGESAAIVGEVTAENPGSVVLDTGLGRRFLREPEGDQLPRIC
jgi:hydrogenase expression/formation protein HypE